MNKIKKWWKFKLVRVIVFFASIAALWQLVVYLEVFPVLLFPSIASILTSLYTELINGELLKKVLYSLQLIFIGMGFAIIGAIVLVLLSSISSFARDITKTLISVMDPLPSIAILPLAILWMGIGREAIIFIMIHSIIWPMVLYVLNGFSSIPQIYEEVAKTIGLKKVKMIKDVAFFSAMPNIITGFKTGWARAWRSLISAEMVFGATGALGGLGWDIYMKRSYLDMPGMFSTLLVIMLIGIIVDDVLFVRLEKATVVKWGMVK